MVKTKKIQLDYILFILFTIVFPFGQLTKFILPVSPLDIIIGLSSLFVLSELGRKTKWVFGILVFSYLLSQKLYFGSDLTGVLYLIRLIAYFCFPFFVSKLIRTKKLSRQEIYSYLLLILTFIAVFGWLQYVIYPDLRFLYHLGWDDHYFRLAGSFLDPGFTALLFVFGFILAANTKMWVLTAFFIISLAFTYSRAGYLAFVGAILAMAAGNRNYKFMILGLILLVISIVSLPTPGGEGVKLGRVASIGARLDNYKDTLGIFRESPLFGIGYNNFCLARQKFLGDIETQSHGCTGSDSSLLLVLATTGVIGFLFFLEFTILAIRRLDKSIYGSTFLACGVALLIHSQFVNSIFYPWVMAFMGGLSALALRRKTNA